MTCTVPNCRAESTMASPGDWCRRHWDQWFMWPEHKPDLPWFPGEPQHVKSRDVGVTLQQLLDAAREAGVE